MPLCPQILRILYEQNLARNKTTHIPRIEHRTSDPNASINATSELRTFDIETTGTNGNTSFGLPANGTNSSWMALESNATLVVERSSWLNELHLIKAVVLVVVVCALLLSTCKVVFQTFSKYSGGGGGGGKKFEQR
jgi:hypothetical protein